MCAQPLCILFNLSLEQDTFPDVWKAATVCPILKCGDTSEVTIYRQITLLCNFAKVFEMSLYNRIYQTVKNIISLDQHGFMEKRSTNTNLTCLTQFLSKVLDQQGQVDVICTDLSKAFDRIDHRFLAKLSELGFSDALVNFFRSYLADRFQFATCNCFKSCLYEISSGVPQGSNLGLLFFCPFINDLNDVIGCQKLFFADDLKIFSSIISVDDCIDLQVALDNVVH